MGLGSRQACLSPTYIILYRIPSISPVKEPEQEEETPQEQDSEDDGPIDIGSSGGEQDSEGEDGEGEGGEGEDGEGGDDEMGEMGELDELDECEAGEEVEEEMREEIPLTQPAPLILDESQREEETPWDALDDEEDSVEEPTKHVEPVEPTPQEVSPESLYGRIQEVEKKLSLARKELTAKILDFVFGHSFSCLLFPLKRPNTKIIHLSQS